jgi:hypothetical protein
MTRVPGEGFSDGRYSSSEYYQMPRFPSRKYPSTGEEARFSLLTHPFRGP